jgi:prephenate dehydrogenase
VTAPFRQVGLFGLGLMGASLAGALRAAGFAGRVVGCSGNPGSLAKGRERGWLDDGGPDPAAVARGCDLLVFCAPVERIPEDIRAARTGLQPGALLTDVGSTKAWLAETVPGLLAGSGAHFVPAHPMCGSEKSGFDAARADLYQGATCAVCPAGDDDALSRVEAFWHFVGCRVLRMSAADHDAWAARTSHLPHLGATLLSLATRGEDPPPPGLLALVGAGFRDTTRLAAGSPTVWREIVATNAQPIGAALQALAERLDHLRAALAARDWPAVERLLADGAHARRDLLPPETPVG